MNFNFLKFIDVGNIFILMILTLLVMLRLMMLMLMMLMLTLMMLMMLMLIMLIYLIPGQSSADSVPPCSSCGKSKSPNCLVAILTQSP